MRTESQWQSRERELLQTTGRYLERARIAERLAEDLAKTVRDTVAELKATGHKHEGEALHILVDRAIDTERTKVEDVRQAVKALAEKAGLMVLKPVTVAVSLPSERLDAAVASAAVAGADFAEVNPDGWVPWSGGDCPLHPDAIVTAKLRSGAITSAMPARRFRWNHTPTGDIGYSTDVVAYRMRQREPGFYWVLRDGTWQVAEWTGTSWWLVGSEDSRKESAFTAVGQRVKQ